MTKNGSKADKMVGIKVMKRTEEHRKHLSEASKTRGKTLSEEQKKKISEGMKKAILEGRFKPKGNINSGSFTSETSYTKFHKGINHPNWKGGKSLLYHDIKYLNWRRLVFERDNYICQRCGIKSQKGQRIILNAHHIKFKSLFPSEIYSLDNGITLCKECHYEVHKNNQINQYSIKNAQ